MATSEEEEFEFKARAEAEAAKGTGAKFPFGQIVKQAGREAFMRPGTITRKLATSPTAQARALPPLMGMVGGLSMVPGGSTLGTVGGRQLSNLALRAYGRPDLIPSTRSQIGEGALAALGDIAAFPAIKKSYYGGQIGAVEGRAGVPPPQDIPSLPRPAGTEPVTGAIDEAVNQVKQAATSKEPVSPVFWKQIKDQVDWLYQRGKDTALSPLDRGKLRWLNQAVQKGLNVAVPGRAGPAQAMARGFVLPQMIQQSWQGIPRWLKYALATGLSAGAGATGVEALLGHRASRGE